ncbi:MAG: DUF1992 domain-containing protein [Acidobacteriota bacterium]
MQYPLIRYNPSMSFEKLAEEKIKEAMESGEFDNLAGKGKPIDLTAYFATPEDLRIGYSILKNANVLPQEAALLKEAETLRAKLERATNEEEKRKLKRAIDETIMKYNLLIEKYRKKK